MMSKAPKHRRIEKHKTFRDRKWLDRVRDMPCIITGRRSSDAETVDPMHIGTAGKGLKAPDNEVLPVLHSYHALAHSKGEMTVLREFIPDDVFRDMIRLYAREFHRENSNG